MTDDAGVDSGGGMCEPKDRPRLCSKHGRGPNAARDEGPNAMSKTTSTETIRLDTRPSRASIPGPCARLLGARLTAPSRAQALRDALERTAETLDYLEQIVPEDAIELWATMADLADRVRIALADDAVAAECLGPRAIGRALVETHAALVEADQLMSTGELVAR